MPIRHYECPNNHITEKIEPVKKAGKTIYTLEQIKIENKSRTKTIRCPKCKKKAVEVYLSRKEEWMAKNFDSALLYVDDKGNVFNPGRNDPSQLPKELQAHLKKNGYKQTIITNFRDYEKFTRQQRILLKDQRDEYINNLQQDYNNTINREIEALRSGGEMQLTNPDGTTRTVKVPRLEDMHPKMRALAELAIERARNHRIDRPFNDPIIAAMEYDSNTRIAMDERTEVRAGSYRDKDTGWTRRG
jgi:hypothetical protein